MNIHSFVCVTFLSILVQKGSSLKCYECTTLVHQDTCGQEFEPEGVPTTDCNDTHICGIHFSPKIANLPKIVQRGCIKKYYCNKIHEVNEHCFTCEEDLCNASSSTIFRITSFILWFFINRFL